MGLIGSILPGIDSILGIRDSIGVNKKSGVFLVTRTWYTDAGHTIQASQIGEGYALDVEAPLTPSPQIMDFTQSINIREGGMVKGGDLILKMISKNSFTEAQLDGTSSAANVEKLYRVGATIYQVISVTEDYVTWNVQLRQLSNQARY